MIRSAQLPLPLSPSPQPPGVEEVRPAPSVADMSLSAAARWFMEERFRTGRRLSRYTRLAWENDLGELARFLGNPRVGDIRESDLVRFLEFLEAKGRSARSRRRAQTSLRAFFRWAVEHGLPHDPMESIPLIPYTLPPYPALTPEELGRLVEEARRVMDEGDPRGWLLILLAMAGLKTDEIAELRMDHIREEADGVRLHIRARTARHRGVVRVATLPAPLWQEAMRIWAAREGQLLRDRRVRAKRMAGYFWAWDRARMVQILHRIARRAGVRPPTINQLRWTSAVRDLVRGISEEAIRERLGVSRAEWRAMLPRLQEARRIWERAGAFPDPFRL